jgi:hypothetical protein
MLERWCLPPLADVCRTSNVAKKDCLQKKRVFFCKERPASYFELEPTARKAYEAQLKPLLVEQDDDDLPAESLLENTESTLVGLIAPHLGHFRSEPSSPTFCKASNLCLHSLH